MFKLYGKRRHLNVDQLKKDIFGENEKDNLFEKVEIKFQDESKKSVTDNLEKVIKQICRLKSSANIIESGDKYSIAIKFDKLSGIDNVNISPLLSNKVQRLSEHTVFEDLRILQLSEFYVVEAFGHDESVQRVIKIKTENMPSTRESSVINSVIKDKRGFIQYITFILGEDYLLSMLDIKTNEKNSFMFLKGDPIPALYEKMLKAAVHSPQKFDEIKRLLELITDEKIIPDGFKELFEVFDKVVKKK